MTLSLETERLHLRPLRLEDESDCLEFHSNPDVVRYIPWPVRDRAQVQEWLGRKVAQSKSEFVNPGDFMVFAWELKSTGKVIGQSNFSLLNVADRSYDFGYVTHQDFQRQGYAYEASKAVLEFIFTQLNAHRVIANIVADNPASGKLAQKLGMRLEGHFIDSEWFKEHWCSMWLYAMLDRDFKSLN